MIALQTGNVIAGFSAASSATRQANPAGNTPRGLFDSLLDIADKVTETVTKEARAAVAAVVPEPDHTLTPPTTPTPTPTETSAAPAADAAPADADAPRPRDILTELADTLQAIEAATDTDAPLDPALEDRLDELLAAIAALLGVNVPGATTDAAAGDATADAEPNARLAQLATRLGELAGKLDADAPDLAAKLEAIAGKLGSGALSAEALAKLGLASDASTDVELTAALDRLLNAKAEVAATQKPFTDPALALPATVAAPGKEKPAATAPAPQPVAAAPEAKPDAEAKPELKLEASHKPDATTPEAKSSFRREAPVASAAAIEADATQQPSTPTTANAGPASGIASVSAETKSIHAAYRVPVQQINIPQIAFEVARQVQAGNSRFQIRLDPPELGRVDVRLDVDKAGNVSARMTVERAETLDLMQRDQRALERALAQAGLDSSKTNLEFSLRQNPFAHDERQQPGGGFPRFAGGGEGETDDAAPLPQIAAYRGLATAGGVNLFV